MTRDEALTLSKSGWWLDLDAFHVAAFQLREPLLCMPWGEFQQAVEKALGRGVWTHEFALPADLLAELLGERTAPTMQEILDMVPAERRIVLVTS